MYTEVLDIYFLNNYTGKEIRLRVHDPKEDLDIIMVEVACDDILASNVLGSDVTLVSAQIVKTTIDEMEF